MINKFIFLVKKLTFLFKNLFKYFLNKLSNLNNNNKRYILLIVDFFIILFSYIIVNFFFNDIQNKNFYTLPIWTLPVYSIISIFVYFLSGQYNSITRYILSSEIFKIALTNSIIIISLICFGLVLNLNFASYKLYILMWFITTFSIVITRFSLKEIAYYVGTINNNKINKVGIYGAGAAGAQLASSLLLAGNHNVEVFFDDSRNLWGRRILGIKIVNSNEIYKYKNRINQILFAIPSLDKKSVKKILEKIKEYEIPVLKVPSIEELTSGEAKIDSLKPIEIDDLLGRVRVEPSPELLENSSKNKHICITGAGGTIGKEIFFQIIKLRPLSIVLIDSSEISLYNLEQELEMISKNYRNTKIYLKLGDVKNYSFLKDVFESYKINVVYHAAAYKHVPLLERNPLQGIENNIISTYSICKAANSTKVNKLILISSDKAVRPTNVMGATKRFSELIMLFFSNFENNSLAKSEVIYSIVRFGNVLGSSGSVVPLFKKQIALGGPITITDKNVIRYFMTVTEAAQLVIQASSLSKGGDIFLLDMGNPIRIEDLAKQMIRLSGLSVRNKLNPKGDIEIIATGLRPGEKLYEELLIDGKPERSVHPLIFKAKEKEINYNQFSNDIKLLIKSIEDYDQNQTLNILSKYVPEWRKSF